jgi:hypothetical protein
MKSFLRFKFIKQPRNLSICAILALGIIILLAFLPKLINARISPIDVLPTWEVQNPVSTVFAMDFIPPTAGSLAAGDSTVPNEYLDDPAIDTLLMMMQTKDIYFYKTVMHPSGIVGSDNVVIIKGNFQWTNRNTTSTDRIKGIIWQILQHPDGFTGEIIVCDNTQTYGINQEDNNSEDPEQSIVDVVNTFASKGYPVYLRDWSNVWDVVVDEYSSGDYNEGFVYESASKISYPKFTSPSGNYNISLKYGIWNPNSLSYDLDRLCIIDFPVLKAHSWAGATIAVKNWIGVLTTAYANARYGGTNSMHYTYFFGPYALVAKVMGATFPKLTIVDAAWTSTESNSTLNGIVNTKMLLGSTDPCAVSWYVAKYILTPIAVDPNNTDPDLQGSNYKNNLESWTNCLRDSGFACSKDPFEISVYDRNILLVTEDYLSVNIKVFLEGPYSGGGVMTKSLNTNNLIPLNSNTAYSTVTYSYTASVVGNIPNSNVVDWVLIELRTGTASGTKVGTRAAFLKSDGTIVDVDGTSPVCFAGLAVGNYYVVARHRNHLAIMTASAIALSGSSVLYDFSTSQSQAYTSGTDPMVALSGGGFGMIAGDANTSAIITAADITPIMVNLNTSGYNDADINMSAIVTAADITQMISNLNRATNVPN